jgi:tRNA pseudouridine55 synthase
VSPIDGLLIVDKPAGPTSHDVVARCRRIFGQKRVGHAGTLDPDATGVLLVGLGQATRLMQYLSGLPKRYTAEVVLGVATTTLDSSGEVTGTWDMSGVDLRAAQDAARSLTGAIVQVPPMVSALKVGGRRLHQLAREGVEVERAARPVTVYRLAVSLAADGEEPGSPVEPARPGGPVLAIDVECSSGTYVRTLAADLGALLGGGAHLRRLRRMSVGPYTVDESVSVSELEEGGEPAKAVLAPVEALRGMDRVTVTEELVTAVGHGKVLPLATLSEGGGLGPWAVLSGEGKLLAVYELHGAQQAKPAVVLVASGA